MTSNSLPRLSLPSLTQILTSANDTFAQVGNTPLWVIAGADNDDVAVRDLSWVSGGNGDDIIRGVSYDTATGDGVRLSGDAGNDKVFGSRGNDILSGGTGNDVLGGGGSYTLGGDEMWGGTGADRFYQSTGTKNAVSGFSSGFARDFSIAAGDTIALGGATGYTLTDASFKGSTGTWVSASNDCNVNIFVAGVTSTELANSTALNGGLPLSISGYAS
jgi:Ca2+-binding RTX toxin-like protein